MEQDAGRILFGEYMIHIYISNVISGSINPSGKKGSWGKIKLIAATVKKLRNYILTHRKIKDLATDDCMFAAVRVTNIILLWRVFSVFALQFD